MNENVFIPKLCKVGFQSRESTYTGKLGYVICKENNKWRKESSWESWRTKVITQEEFDLKKTLEFNKQKESMVEYYNHSVNNPVIKGKYDYYQNCRGLTMEEFLKSRKVDSIDTFYYKQESTTFDTSLTPIEFNNEPIEGFVLNKKAGGYSSGWNHRNTYCRVYDPRGFEFEINIENLLYILDNTNSIVGKGLEGKFIYGWSGKDLILLSENSEEYKKSLVFSVNRSKSIGKNDLVSGCFYLAKSGRKLLYLTTKNKTHFFADVDAEYDWNKFTAKPSLDSFATKISDEIYSETHYWLEELEYCESYSPKIVEWTKINNYLNGYNLYIKFDDKFHYLSYSISKNNYAKYYLKGFNNISKKLKDIIRNFEGTIVEFIKEHSQGIYTKTVLDIQENGNIPKYR